MGDGFQPEGRPNQGISRKKKQRPPKRIGSYRLMQPRSRTASLKERDHDVLEATRNLVLTDSISLSNIEQQIVCPAETGGKREEWEDIFISVRSDRDLDCESAWSQRTHSTAHQPTVITSIKRPKPQPTSITTDPVKVSSKSGFPIDDVELEGKSGSSQEDDASIASSIVGSRPPHETSDERRERKQAIKEAQREARIRKKQTKMLYRQETVRQQQQLAGMTHKHISVIEL